MDTDRLKSLAIWRFLIAFEHATNVTWLNAYGSKHRRLRELVDSVPDSLWTSSYFVRAVIHLLGRVRNTRLCVEILERSLGLTAPRVRVWQARLLFRQHAHPVLLRATEKMTPEQLMREGPAVLKWVARSALSLREYERAVECLEVYVTHDDAVRASRVWLAHALLGIGRIGEAAERIDAYLVDWPRDGYAAAVERRVLIEQEV